MYANNCFHYFWLDALEFVKIKYIYQNSHVCVSVTYNWAALIFIYSDIDTREQNGWFFFHFFNVETIEMYRNFNFSSQILYLFVFFPLNRSYFRKKAYLKKLVLVRADQSRQQQSNLWICCCDIDNLNFSLVMI